MCFIVYVYLQTLFSELSNLLILHSNPHRIPKQVGTWFIMTMTLRQTPTMGNPPTVMGQIVLAK